MITLRIDDIPSSNNKYIGRDAKWAYQDEKKKWAWLIKAAAAPVKPGVPYEYADVTLRYSFKDKSRNGMMPQIMLCVLTLIFAIFN